MTKNLEIWEKFEDIDPKFTKPITGKDYKGTSPNAHYIIRCLTELFGPVGLGFGWRVLADGIERFGETSIHWCRIEFWHTDRANTFESYGQTKMAYMTRGQNQYLKIDEDAPKKSLTDAITKAAAQVGIAANIFLGRWDDNRYVAGVDADYREKERAELSPPFNAQAAAGRIIAKLSGATSIEDLKARWNDEQSVIAEIKAASVNEYNKVNSAKDNRKNVLEATNTTKPADDLGGDEIPEFGASK